MVCPVRVVTTALVNSASTARATISQPVGRVHLGGCSGACSLLRRCRNYPRRSYLPCPRSDGSIEVVELWFDRPQPMMRFVPGETPSADEHTATFPRPKRHHFVLLASEPMGFADTAKSQSGGWTGELVTELAVGLDHFGASPKVARFEDAQ